MDPLLKANQLLQGTVADPNLKPEVALHTHLKAAFALIEQGAASCAGSEAATLVTALKPLLSMALTQLSKVSEAIDCSPEALAEVGKSVSAALAETAESVSLSGSTLPTLSGQEKAALQGTVECFENYLESIAQARADLEAKSRVIEAQEAQLFKDLEELERMRTVASTEPAEESAETSGTEEAPFKSRSAAEILQLVRVEANGRLNLATR